ncbi:BZ3500_MvSof-1268-A1-R1_Chr1-3g01957 [Microbotryum saponariae]|uniref:BZ3500_MvSof-1268-A1-R1_Chr1-3g01957 protein n=1 Tax=Microbotryum saponariae TaxID=289078 RepID=A0A2X0ML80_9BASI|nr:BZ3500_MvSof-1268-A1-R1_Chr1-3g01957 [Microbotryum saponariae]SCZ95010.1 BZ3501_MvSof-1269-A2-R1_Chr1-3g01559 [Microbotryum saponariae]
MPSQNTDPSGYDTSEELKLAPDMAQSPLVLGKAQGSFFDADDVAPEFLDENGKERPIETALDFSTRLMSLDDDPSLQVHTVRMWTIGLGLTCFGAALGQIFYFRPQTYGVSSLFLQIIAYIMGNAWHQVLPRAAKGHFWAALNPGPFNIKEHVCITVMSSTGSGGALAISTLAAERLYCEAGGHNNIDLNYGIAISIIMASQFFGYGLGGLCRSIAVYPTYALWPNLIPTVNLFDTLHRNKDGNVNIRRYKLFWIAFATIFVWEWFPEIIAPTLTGISVFCLSNRTSRTFTRIFGGTNGNEGLGLFSIGLDWLQIGSSSLSTPLASMISNGIGVVLCIVISLAGYYGNIWDAKNYPFLGQALFYENGSIYDQQAILDSHYNLNKTALAEQGIPSYTWTNAVYIFGINLGTSASFMHVFLWYRQDMKKAFRKWQTRTQDDPHYLKMLAYPECGMLIYAGVSAAGFVMALATLYAAHSGMPWYALVIGCLYAAIELPIDCVISSITGSGVVGSNMARILGAALVPGNARASLYFQIYSSNSVAQGAGMVADLKLGQYTKVPPRAMFIVQSAGTIAGSILSLVVMNSIIDSHREILLSVEGSNLWSGNIVQSFNSDAVTWGALGTEMWGPLIGLFIPIPVWLGHKCFPKLHLDQVVTPIICFSLGYLSVGINSSVMATFIISFWSQFYLRKKRANCFRKYNYLLAAALDGGTQLMVFVSTFAINGGAGKQYTFPQWALNPPGHYDYCASSATTDG